MAAYCCVMEIFPYDAKPIVFCLPAGIADSAQSLRYSIRFQTEFFASVTKCPDSDKLYRSSRNTIL